MPLIRDTIDPLNEREVSDEEALDLERQNVVLTGTRAKTPDGLRAAAVRQVLDGEADAFAAETADRPRMVTAADREQGDEQDDELVDDADEDETDVEDDETPGADPVSTTENTPTRTSTQES